MKTSDIISQLRAVLPTKTELFSSRFTVTSISKAGVTATATTSVDHGLSVGEFVTVAGVLTPVQISAVTDQGDSYLLTTVTEHDLTLHPTLDSTKTVRITSTGYDEVFTLTDVPNRFKFVIAKGVQPALPVTVKYLQDQCIRGYNGIKQVASIPANNQFTFAMDFDLPMPNYVTGAFVYVRHRISGAISVDVVLNSYTKQPDQSLWAFVVLGDFGANKDRKNMNDAISTQGRQGDWQQKLICNFSVFVIVPNKGDVLTKTNGRAARDVIEDIRKPLLQSLLGVRMNARLTAQGQGVVTFAGDSFYLYNDAYYVHEFTFQQVDEITFGDTAIVEFDRAFRDVDLTIQNQFSEVSEYLALVNLDDEPEV